MLNIAWGNKRSPMPYAEEPHPARELLPARDLEAEIGAIVADYNHLRYGEAKTARKKQGSANMLL
jgi:hypothetical protein